MPAQTQSDQFDTAQVMCDASRPKRASVACPQVAMPGPKPQQLEKTVFNANSKQQVNCPPAPQSVYMGGAGGDLFAGLPEDERPIIQAIVHHACAILQRSNTTSMLDAVEQAMDKLDYEGAAAIDDVADLVVAYRKSFKRQTKTITSGHGGDRGGDHGGGRGRGSGAGAVLASSAVKQDHKADPEAQALKRAQAEYDRLANAAELLRLACDTECDDWQPSEPAANHDWHLVLARVDMLHDRMLQHEGACVHRYAEQAPAVVA